MEAVISAGIAGGLAGVARGERGAEIGEFGFSGSGTAARRGPKCGTERVAFYNGIL